MFSFLMSAVYFIILLTIIVFVHEFGHYYVAKKCGVKIEQFSIGMGKKLFGFTDKNGVEWKFCLFPIGGYVQMYGDKDASSFGGYSKNPSKEMLKYSLLYKHPAKKIAIAFAGPFMNFVLAFCLLFFVFFAHGKPVIKPVIGKVLSGSYAEKSGILPDDKILSVNGIEVKDFRDMPLLMKNEKMKNEKNDNINLQVLRNNKTLNLKAQYNIGETFGISSKIGEVKYEKVGLLNSAKDSCFIIKDISVKTFKAIYNIVVHQKGLKSVGGPIAIAKAGAEAGRSGFWAFVFFMAIISVGLGAVNLLPVPMLDGGHIFVNFIELITRRKFGNLAYKIFVIVGIGFISCLMALGFINDLFINR